MWTFETENQNYIVTVRQDNGSGVAILDRDIYDQKIL